MLTFLLRPAIIVPFLLISIFIGACTKGQEVNAVSQDEFASELEKRLFTQDPATTDHLAEMRTGLGSWDVSRIVLDVKDALDEDIDMEALLSESLDLGSEHAQVFFSRHDLSAEEIKVAEQNPDLRGADLVAMFVKTYPQQFTQIGGKMVAISGYDLQIALSERRGTGEQRVHAYLLYDAP